MHNAGRDGIITDSETWLEYIKEVNHCLSITDQDLRKKAMIKLLDNFRNRIQSMLILMHSLENNKFMEEKKAIYQEICNRELILPDNPVNYSCEDLLITEKSYKMLIDYFRSYPQINRVWIHGSRAYGTSHSTSDLDLLFDCDKTTWEKILNEFDNILIPYFIDGKNIYDKEREPLNKIAMYYGAKKIYDKKDFQIFWEDRKPFINNAIKIDMSKLI